jgi:hypothetical protein
MPGPLPERKIRIGRFLRENWIYVVAPILIVIVLLVALYLLGGGSEAAPFVYPIF